MKTIDTVIKENQITIVATSINSRPDLLMQDCPNHWEVTLTNGKTDTKVTLFFSGGKAIKKALLPDVLNSLISDYSFVEYSYTEFCAELGYDSNEESEEGIQGILTYSAVKQSAKKLCTLLPNVDFYDIELL